MAVRWTLSNDPDNFYRDEQGREFYTGAGGVPFHIREKAIAVIIAKMAKETVVGVPIDNPGKRRAGIDLRDRRHLRKRGD